MGVVSMNLIRIQLRIPQILKIFLKQMFVYS